ncbi:MAG: GNAT family N-acetyltransferase [Bacteroidales bacterium]
MKILEKNRYAILLEPVKKMSINHYCARAVLENQVDGQVYVDDLNNPLAFLIVHPYGMSFLSGKTENPSFINALKSYMLNQKGERDRTEWLQAYPENWNRLIEDFLGEKLVNTGDMNGEKKGFVGENHRVNFKFNAQKYSQFRKEFLTGNLEILQVSKKWFDEIEGSVIPKNFWRTADDFYRIGKGFSVVMDGKPVSTAFSAFVFENDLELGIETIGNYRGKSLAAHACCALIDYCLQKGLEPVWSCRLENTASYLLAQKLGFEPTVYLPFYKLNT